MKNKTQRNKFIVQALSMLLICSLALFVPVFPPAVVHATGTTYYVSTSGSDNNNGTSPSTPWQSLNKVSGITFSPGDTILLKRGDTWSGQVLSLKTNGGSHTNWVTLDAYGDTALARPQIFPGASSQYSVLIYNDNLNVRNCGWKILNIEVGYAKNGIYAYDAREGITDVSQQLDGLWVQNCYIHDITGNPSNPYAFPDFFSSGIRCHSNGSWLHDITFINNQISHCDLGISGLRMDYFTIQDNTVSYTNFHGIEFCLCWNGMIDNTDVLHAGQVGLPFGIAAIEFDNSTYNITVQNCEVAYTLSQNCPDGCGIDFEGYTDTIIAQNNTIHDNSGRAFLFMPNNYRTQVKNNTCYANGYDSDYITEPAFAFINGNTDNGGEISGNVITRLNANQKVNNIAGGPTDAFPSSGFTVFNNTITGSATATATPTPTATQPGDHTWDFNGSVQNWEAQHDISNFTSNNGCLEGTITNSDPYMASGDNLNINISSNKTITLRMKNSTNCTTAEIFFSTTTDGSFDGNKHKLFTIVANDTGYTTYTIDMSDVAGYTGTLRRLRIDPTIVGSGSFSIDWINVGVGSTPTDTATPTPTPTSTGSIAADWEFNSDGNFEGWSNSNNISNLSVSGGKMNGTVTGADPYIYSPDTLNIDASANKIITIRLKNSTSSNYGELYFITNSDTSFNETKKAYFSITPNDSGYTTYTIDMSSVSGWTGTLRRFRIDPENGQASGTFSIDSVTVGSSSTPTVTATPTPTPTPTATSAPGVGWDFNTNGNVENWWNANDITNFTANNGYLEGTITGSDPNMWSADNLNFSSSNKYIHIRMKNSTGSLVGQIFFTTTADGNFNEAKSKMFTIVANDPNYTEYIIDMSTVSGWTGTIRRLRVDPAAYTGSFSIDYILVSAT